MTIRLRNEFKAVLLFAGIVLSVAGGAIDAGCQTGPGAEAHTAQSTREMAERLQAIFRANDWKRDPNKPAERAAYYEKMLQERKLTPAEQMQVLLQLATELLQAGDSEKAIQSIERLRQVAQTSGVAPPDEFDTRVRSLAAISYLRLGEQENCAHMHGQKSCLFPIKGSGIHTLPRGAEGAVRELTAMLERNPRDWQSQWLLNVAYMQLGRYPKDVPKRWLVDESLFRSERDLGEFDDVAMQAGLAVLGHSGGAVMEDFDGDGLLDVAVTSSGPLDQMHLFHNNGDGTFSDWTARAGLTGETGGLNMIATDFDNDGHIDLLVLRGGWWGRFGEYPMSLLHNRGDGTFEDVTVKAGLLSLHPTQTAAWADYDGDGWLDLFVGHESGSMDGGATSKADEHPSQLFHNNHDGTFTEVGAAMGLANLGFVKGVAWGDFNNDGRPDLYVSVKGGRNHLFRNDGPGAAGAPWRFTDVTAQADVAQQTESFATWFFDYDNDGWPDIFVAGYSTQSLMDVGAFELNKPFQAETPRLYRNNHDGTFTDVARQTGLDRAILVMGASFGDLDNDGWLDVYLGTGESRYEALLPNRMFRNAGGKVFEDVTTSGGFGHLQKGHSVAFGDLGNNGHEDVFEEMGGAFPGDTYTSVLYRNPGNTNHWVTLELEGVKANRPAIGARLDVTIQERGVTRHIFRTVGFGSSFGGNPLRQHIGVGQAAVVKSVEVRWPGSNTVQRFNGLGVDRMFHLREGEAMAREVKLKSFRIGGGPMPAMAEMKDGH
jgi:Flp pilus assembly protein TadD